MKYEQWLKSVRAAVLKLAHVDLDDLPDTDIYAMYEQDMSPMRAARNILVEAGF